MAAQAHTSATAGRQVSAGGVCCPPGDGRLLRGPADGRAQRRGLPLRNRRVHLPVEVRQLLSSAPVRAVGVPVWRPYHEHI